MKRRVFVAGALAVPLVGFARPDALAQRKAVFEEVGQSVRMTLALPGLFRRHDTDALASIDSGFDTTLHFTLRVWEWGTRKLASEQTLIVKVRRDPWKKRYVVSTRTAKGWTKRFFSDRAKAVASAVRLQRALVAQTDALARGEEDGPYYFVEILALRNPLSKSARADGPAASGRGSGRDLEWFGRLVDVLAGERPRAEEVVHVRTNPFFLVPS